MQSLALSWLFTSLNTDLVPETDGVLRHVVVFAALVGASRFTAQRSSGSANGLQALLFNLMMGGLVLHSLLLSTVPELSLLRLASWAAAFMSIATALSAMSEIEVRKVEKFIFGMLTMVALLSVPLLGSSAGVQVNGTGFQGLLNHPQVFGVTMALLCSLIVGVVFAGSDRTSLLVVLGVVSVYLMIQSEARTSALALLVGIMAAASSSTFAPTGLRGRTAKRSKRRVILLLGLLVSLIAVGAFTGSLRGPVDSFIEKSGRAEVDGISDAFAQSRGDLIDGMIRNIREDPLAGIGFGVPSSPDEVEIARDPIFNLPVGAPTEKGVLPVMIVEEVGVPLSVFIFIWLLSLLAIAGRNGPAQLAVCLTVIAANLGEAMLFSPGGNGMLAILLIVWASRSGSSSRHRPYNGAQREPNAVAGAETR
ncbi:MAG: hypothetical protein ACE367_18125 [Acidimicrobiales bacterium]